MLQDFRSADFEKLAGLWSKCFPQRYAVTPALIRQKTVESPVFDWGASAVSVNGEGDVAGFIVVKKSPTPTLYKGYEPDQAHVGAIACRDPLVGMDLMSQAKVILRDRGVIKLVFGADSSHFFPGCPVDVPQLRDFLMIQGFTLAGEQHDVERDLGDYEPPKGCLSPLGSDAVVRPVTQADLPALDGFFEREFPSRWRHDVMHQVRLEGRPDLVDGLFVDGKCEGFSFTQDWECNYPIGGAVWRLDLGERWGSLGPIGISQGVRGKGLGGALLGASLKRLHERGARRTIIDWTTLLEFYGKHGFERARTYLSASLSLEAPTKMEGKKA